VHVIFTRGNNIISIDKVYVISVIKYKLLSPQLATPLERKKGSLALWVDLKQSISFIYNVRAGSVAFQTCVLKWNLETAGQNKNLDNLALWKLRCDWYGVLLGGGSKVSGKTGRRRAGVTLLLSVRIRRHFVPKFIQAYIHTYIRSTLLVVCGHTEFICGDVNIDFLSDSYRKQLDYWVHITCYTRWISPQVSKITTAQPLIIFL